MLGFLAICHGSGYLPRNVLTSIHTVITTATCFMSAKYGSATQFGRIGRLSRKCSEDTAIIQHANPFTPDI